MYNRTITVDKWVLLFLTALTITLTGCSAIQIDRQGLHILFTEEEINEESTISDHNINGE